MAKLANIAQIPVPSTEKGQRSVSIGEAFFARIIPSWSQPSVLLPEQWRAWVKSQPIATACKETMVSNLSDLDWKVTPRESDQRDELRGNIKHYEKLLQRGGESGLDWVGFLEWAMEDLLDLPFGSAWEVGRKGDAEDGRVMWLEPIDGGTCYPTNNKDYPVYQYYNGFEATFPKHAIARMYMNPRPEIERKGWGVAPPERIFLAMEMLMRGDRYYANLLLDIPPAGVFDLGDITWEDANTWIQSFRTAVTGVGSADSFKIPVLAEHTGKVEFIPLGKAPNDIMYDRITLKYASLVTAGYGMSLSDIGVQAASASGQTLAGGIRDEQKTNRTGKARYKAKIKYFIETFLPDTLQFDFIDTDGERLAMLGRARLANATAMNQYREMEAISPEEARLQAIQDGLFTISMPEKPPKEAKKPIEPMLGKKTPERPASVGSPQPPSLGGDGEVKKSIEFVSYPSEIDSVVEKVVSTLAPNIRDGFSALDSDDYEPMKSELLKTVFEEDRFSESLGLIVRNVGEFRVDGEKLELELRSIFEAEGVHILNMDAHIVNMRKKCQQEFPSFFGKAIAYTLINSDRLFSDDLLPVVQAEVRRSLSDYVSSFIRAELEAMLNEVEQETPNFLTPTAIVRRIPSPITVEAPQVNTPVNVTIPERSVYVEGSTVNVSQPDVEVNLPEITVNTPQQEAPVVNLSIPETQVTVEAPVVNMNVPETQVTVNNQVNPTPVEVKSAITVEPAQVVIPKPVREFQTVARRNDGLIESTDTSIEYEEEENG